MNNINDCFLFINTLANKQFSGSLSPDEFNNLAPIAQMNHLRVMVGLPEVYTLPMRQAPIQLEATQFEQDIIRPFLVSTPLTSTDGTFAIPPDFFAYRPSSYLYTYTVNGQPQSRPIGLEFVTSGERDMRRNNFVTPPTLGYPLISYEDGKFVVDPVGDILSITLRYVKRPTDPVWNYTVNANDQPVYDPIGSVDFQFPKSEWEIICNRILKDWAVKIREEGLYSAANKTTKEGQ